MSNTVKGIRKMVRYAGIDVEAFQLPDGSYRVSQSSASTLIGKRRESMSEFCQTKAAKALPGVDFSVSEIGFENQIGKPANGMTIEAVMAYWKHWAIKGDENAINLLAVGTAQDLERTIDAKFQVSRTEEQYEERRVEKLKKIRQIVWARLKEETGYEVSGFQIDEPDTPVPGNHPKFKKIEYHRIEDVLWYFNPRTDTFSVAPSTPNRKDYDLWEAFCGFYETFGTLESNMRVLKGLRAAASELAPHLIR